MGFSLLLAIRAARRRLPVFGSMAGAEWSGVVASWIAVALFAIVLGIALGWFNRITWRWLVPAGALTYPLYLVHGYAGYAIINYFSPRVDRYMFLGALGRGPAPRRLAGRTLHRAAAGRG